MARWAHPRPGYCGVICLHGADIPLALRAQKKKHSASDPRKSLLPYTWKSSAQWDNPFEVQSHMTPQPPPTHTPRSINGHTFVAFASLPPTTPLPPYCAVNTMPCAFSTVQTTQCIRHRVVESEYKVVDGCRAIAAKKASNERVFSITCTWTRSFSKTTTFALACILRTEPSSCLFGQQPGTCAIWKLCEFFLVQRDYCNLFQSAADFVISMTSLFLRLALTAFGNHWPAQCISFSKISCDFSPRSSFRNPPRQGRSLHGTEFEMLNVCWTPRIPCVIGRWHVFAWNLSWQSGAPA